MAQLSFLSPPRQWPVVRLPVAAGIAIALLAFGALGGSRLVVETDITALLPDRGQDRSALYELVRGAGFMRKVAIVVGPGAPGSDELHQAIDAMAKAAGHTAGVAPLDETAGMEPVRRAAMTVAGGAANLASDDVRSLDDSQLLERLEELKKRLAAPEAMVTQSFLLTDPLGFGRPALQSLEGLSRSMGAVVERGHILSEDRRFGLVAATLDFDPLDVDRSAKFVEDLDRALAAARSEQGSSAPEVMALGGVHFAASSAAAVRGDIVRAFVLTAMAVALVFLVLMRRLRLLPVALLPGGLGIAAGIGVFGLMGIEVHGLTLGFAATLTGVSVDYAIHLLYHALSADPLFSPERRMRLALAQVGRPIVLGCLTTVAAFVLVATSGFPGIRQLAVFAAISVPVAMATTLLILPPLAPLLLINCTPPPAAVWLGARLERLLSSLSLPRRRSVVLALASAILVGFGGLGLTVRLSGDPKELGSDDPDLAQRQHRLEERFAGLSDQVFFVASGGSLEQALVANDALYRVLQNDGVTKERIVSVAPILPSQQRQKQSRGEIAALLGTAVEREQLFTAAGFTPAFAQQAGAVYAPAPLTRDSYAGTALEPLIRETIYESDAAFHVLTRLTGTPEAELKELAKLAAAVPGCSLVSERLETRAALERMVVEMARMLGLWLAVTLAVLWIVRRSLRFSVAAVIPALFGVAAAVAVLGALGRPMTAVASAGLTLVLGLGVDYGIFALSASKHDAGRTALAVLASALTTMAGFGVLASAQVRAMADLGLIILVGVSASLMASLFVAPALGPPAPEEIRE